MSALTDAEFESWLRGYKHAWESRDPRGRGQAVLPDAEILDAVRWPQKGRAEIAAALARRRRAAGDVTFEYRIITTSGATGTAALAHA